MEQTRTGDDHRPALIRDLQDALVAALGADKVSDGESERDLHAADLIFHAPHRPDLVVYASVD